MPVLDSISKSNKKSDKIIEVGKEKTVKRRSKGEKTREKILIAAIEVLAHNGIKGTTHRAIASHAQLQLSLTTYYFKDIQELIQQAFKLNSYLILSRADDILEAASSAIIEINKKELRKVSVKEELCLRLTEMTALHLINNIKHQAISLAVEQLMITEVQISPELRLLAQKHDLAQLIPFERLCSYFNKVDPQLDAKIMHTVFSQLQYSQLAKQTDIDEETITKTAYRIIAWVMGLK
jgi:DNA-binding transcriptional regulator YbjK